MVLEVQQLVFRWPRASYDQLRLPSLQLDRGQSLFVQGPSGCGKSTLIALCAGVLTTAQGKVSLLGQDWAALPPARRDAQRADHVGLIFQQFNLLPWLNVLDNVTLAGRFSPLRRQRCEPAGLHALAQELLERMGLPAKLWGRRAQELSVGQQQRVAAARALLGRPSLVLADEPTSALDEDARDAFMQVLRSQCRESGSALLFVSHDARLASDFDAVLQLPALPESAAP